MKILNQQILKDIEERKPIKLNLGCGTTSKDGMYSVDFVELDGIDVIADLNEPLELLPDNSVEFVYSHHVFEHITEFLPLMKELRRIVKPEGRIEFTVPHFSNPYGYSDPTHVRFFGLRTMNYFADPENQLSSRKVPAFYSDIRFIIEEVYISFYRPNIVEKLIGSILKRVINKSHGLQDLYERRISAIWSASDIRYIIRPDK